MGGERGGIMACWRRLAVDRGIGRQFQENQLRFQITVEDRDLQGKAKSSAREAIVEAEHADFFDYADIEAILGGRPGDEELRAWEVAGVQPRLRVPTPARQARRLHREARRVTRRFDETGQRFRGKCRVRGRLRRNFRTAVPRAVGRRNLDAITRLIGAALAE